VQKEFSIDPDRIYLAGQSMGGLGVWALLQARPDRWAAALVLCAFDNFTNVKEIARIPVWVFQGDVDMSVPVDLVRQMMKDLKKIRRPTALFGISQDRPRRLAEAFAEPDLVTWLAAQRRTR